MSKRMNQTFKVTVLAAALLSVYAPAFAEGPQGEVSVGIGNWTNDRPQRGQYDGMRDEGGYLLLDADVRKRDDATGTWLGLKLRNLGLDNREIGVEWQRQGDIGVSLDYSRISRDNPWLFNTGVSGIGTTTNIVPATSITPGTGSNVELGTVRDRYTFKFFKSFGGDLKFNASFRNETKKGTRQWGRGGDPEFAVEPIDSTIRILEAALTYSRGALQLTGGYYGTAYNNDNGLLITKLSTPTAATTYNLTLPPSNFSHEIFVNGGYNFTPATRGTFKASYSRATQDEFLPTAGAGLTFTTSGNCNSAPGLPVDSCAPDPSAPSHLNGRLDTTLLEAGVTSKINKDLSLLANLRYRDFQDKTPLQPVVFNHDPANLGGATQINPGVPTVWNTPFSYTNTVGKLEANYRMQHGYSLLGGIEFNHQNRTVPTVGDTFVPFAGKLDENTYRIQLRKAMSETVNGSIQYAHSKRDAGDIMVPATASNPAEDLINPLNIADRKRDKWRAMLDWTPMDRLNLQFTLENSTDKYSGAPYGIQNGKAEVYGFDASYQLNRDWSMYGFVSRDITSAKESTPFDFDAAPPQIKFNSLTETGTTFGIGVRGTMMSKLKLGGDVEQFRSVNKFQQDLNVAMPADRVALPNITNKLLRVKLFAQYPIQKNSDLRFNMIYEKWQTDDWTWMMFPDTGPSPAPFVYGTAKDGTTVTQNAKQSSTFAGLRYIYRFE